MPDTEKTEETKNDIMVDIDTSGPEVDVTLPEEKKENENETTIENGVEPDNSSEKSDKQLDVRDDKNVETKETVQENKETENKQEVEDYSEGVKKRIAKLTKKMREAERQKEAALEYAKNIQTEHKNLQNKVSSLEPSYVNAMEGRVVSGLQAAEAKLISAREAGDIKSEVEAQKQIARLGVEEARVNSLKRKAATELKQRSVEQPRTLEQAIAPNNAAYDPKAEEWAEDNSWFGKDSAMTYTAFDLHKKLTEQEGMDPASDEYYKEIDKRMRIDFPHKFGTTEPKVTTKPTQQVASAKRSVNPSRNTVRLTPSQVTIAKKLGVPLEEYAKQLKITEGV
jgi:hypothetical protein|tara:strand:+ start:40 stop:1056 length:1017 start_codon:yes stop_codon:yes gene_type:complete